MKHNIFLSVYQGEYNNVATILKNNLQFQHIQFNNQQEPSIASKNTLLKKNLKYIFQSIKHFKELNHANMIVCSTYLNLFLLLFKRLRVLKVDTICWWGFFIHSPKMLNMLRGVLNIVGRKGLFLVVYAFSEIEYYSMQLRLPKEQIYYMPYGDWQSKINNGEQTSKKREDYYFTGGYSNRNYIPLVKYFEKTNYRLVIAASKQNKDVVDYCQINEISKNITILYDIPTGRFEELLQASKAVILSMKYNTGASGQMVIVSAMRNRKLVISTYTDVISDYITDQVSGIILDKIDDGFKEILNDVEINPKKYEKYIDNAYNMYTGKYTYNALESRLINIFKNMIG